jgi:tetratricopeptide (TPR) repeat protein
MGLAIALRGSKDYEKADEIYVKLLKQDPKNRTLVYNAAILHEKYTKKFDKARKIYEDFQKAMGGALSPSDDVFARLEEVKKSEEAEKARLAKLEQERKEKEEREKRAMALITEMDTMVKSMEKDMADPCVASNAPDVVEMTMMVLEQVKPVIETKDTSMANDMKTFLDDSKAQLDAAKSACQATGAPAPEGAAPAPESAPTPG